jgi:hypothetical protein
VAPTPSPEPALTAKLIENGYARDVNWVIFQTPKGKVICKLFFSGPGLGSDIEVSADFPITDDEAYSVSEDLGDHLRDKSVPQTHTEPDSLPYTIEY